MKHKGASWNNLIKRNVILAIGLAGLYWILQAAVHVVVFNEPDFPHHMFTQEAEDLWVDSFVVLLIIMFGVYEQLTINRHEGIEEALRESEGQYRTVVDNVADAIAINVGTKRVFVNRAYLRLHGIDDVSQVLDISVDKFILPEDRGLVSKRTLARQRGEPVPGVYEYRIQRSDGEVRTVQTSAVAITYKGQPAALAVLRDITESKRAEEERTALLDDLKELNHRLERSNRELQEFAYVASHDLQEPLRKISAFAGLIQNSLQGKLDEDQKENLEFMVDGAQRMQMMVDALLYYSRVATTTQPREPVDLNELIQELRNSELASLVDETKGAIHVPGPLPLAHGDASQIRQLLQNLIGNGLKFHREGVPPEIIIRAPPGENNMLRVEVQDNGIGIGEEYQEQVFTMFKRLNPAASYAGTGIWLVVCKKIVDRHGGDIGVTSSPGKGSTFWFTLPEELLTRSSEKEGGEPWP